jgi:KUP system potassium uptake protein
MLAILGIAQYHKILLYLKQSILLCLSFIKHPSHFFVLGFVFLCTTGAEALYSDMGHCGRKNIRISWVFVKLP